MEPKGFDFVGQLTEALKPVIQEVIKTSVADAMRQYRPQEPEDLMTIPEASEFLRLAKPTIYSKVSRGELPYMKRKGKLYFSRRKLREWVETGK